MTLERLPPPYTNCIESEGEEAESKNMFKGPYTVERCLFTCQVKFWSSCNISYWAARNKMRDPNFVWEDKSQSTIEACLDVSDLSEAEYDKCNKGCRPPCFEEVYEARIEGPNFLGFLNDNFTMISANLDKKEVFVVDFPKQNLLILLPAFGGTLGLLAGVSALSIIEIIIWTVLLVAEKSALLYTGKIHPS